MPTLLLAYVFLSTVILVNLLIAQMSARYETVQEKSAELWLFNRLYLFKEYKDDRDSVPPPFNLIQLVFTLLRSACGTSAKSKQRGYKLRKPLQIGPYAFVLQLSRQCRDKFLAKDDDDKASRVDSMILKVHDE
eukprot:533865-Prymnesium_polylepis.1